MVALATETDVATQLGRDLTSTEADRAADVLIKASDLFRREAKQDFTPGTSTVRLKAEGTRIRLDQYPVTAVTAVVDDDGADVDHVLDGQWLTVTHADGTPFASHEFATITYSHGGTVPDLVRITVAEIAAKVLRITPQAAAGIVTQQRSAGGFQETNTYAGWALGGRTTLAPEDLALARSYRQQRTKVIVCQP